MQGCVGAPPPLGPIYFGSGVEAESQGFPACPYGADRTPMTTLLLLRTSSTLGSSAR
jgi:hypothetical protein